MQKITINQMVKYGGHNVSANGVVNLTLVAKYGELTKTISLMQLLNENISMKARVGSFKPMLLGTFMIKQIIVDGDGESKIKLSSSMESVELDNINKLPQTISDDSQEFAVRIEATIDGEEEESEEEENGDK